MDFDGLSQGLLSLSSSLGAIASSKKEAKYMREGMQSQYENNKKLMEHQYQNQLDFWHMNNEYNTPAAQMQRYKDAGINPYEALGNSNTSSYGSVMQSIPDAPNLGEPKAKQFSQTMFTALDVMERVARIKNVNTDSNLKNVESDYKNVLMSVGEAEQRLKSANAHLSELDALTREALNNTNIALGQARVNTEATKQGVNLSTIKLNGQRMVVMDWQAKELEQSIESMKVKSKLDEKQIESIASIIYLNQLRAAYQSVENQYADEYFHMRNRELNESANQKTLENNFLSFSADSKISKYQWDSMSAEQQYLYLKKEVEWYNDSHGIQNFSTFTSGLHNLFPSPFRFNIK